MARNQCCSICGRGYSRKCRKPYKGAAWCTDCAQYYGNKLIIDASSEDGKRRCHAELNTMMISPSKLSRILRNLNKSFN